MTAIEHDQRLAKTAQYLREYAERDLLRFITCGSVDDGKSTLIGRLLLETNAVYDDQIAGLTRESEKFGTAGDEIDPALLLDGLEDERQQGITIDVAYRYFHTSKRKFIIADSPGHEQYTRNMVTAASTADAAVILIDARKGVLTQTRRHSYIASLLGIKHLVLAVNKMDLVDFSEAVFNQICNDFNQFAEQFGNVQIHAVPLSGLRGDNVARHSDRVPWYDGPALLQVLEEIPLAGNDPSAEFRFPVQRVVRPDLDFRGYSGTVASGGIQVGQRVKVLPGGQESTVASIESFEGQQDSADQGDPVTLTLADEIDIARGDMIVKPDQLPRVQSRFDATLVWMSAQPLLPGKSYWLKHTTRHIVAEVESVAHTVDINTLKTTRSSSLKVNDIGRCRLTAHAPLVIDPYAINRRTGSFILVDRVTHETVAAGMLQASSATDEWSHSLDSVYLQTSPSRISRQARQERFGHPAKTILITGLSCTGKTTIGQMLEEKLFEQGQAVVMIDGQNLRHGISRDLGFSAEDRSENLRRAAYICRTINDAGLTCIAAFVAPDPVVRQRFCEVVGPDHVIHLHLTAPVSVCKQRDKTGRYEAAERNEIANFPGVTWAYEPYSDADQLIDTNELSADQSLALVLETISKEIG